MSPVVLALRALRREWRAGELRILFAALIVAVGGMTAVGFFTDRVELAMETHATELLAADLVLHSPDPIEASLVDGARHLGLATAMTSSFRSMLVIGEQFQLAEVKAVSERYPLRGQLRIASAAFVEDRATQAIPSRGSVWLDSRLISILGIGVGDAIELGSSRFQIESVISYEPDRGGDLFSIAPRLMMHLDDVEATGLVQPGSRVTHALLLAGKATALSEYRREVEDGASGHHFHDAREGRPGIRAALDRAGQFLGLASLVSVLLAGAAIAVSSRRYTERRLDTAAIMRCLGASQRVISQVFVCQVLFLGIAASILGCALGYAAQQVLVVVFEDLLFGALPVPSLKPAGYGLAAGILTLAGFALPPILRLKDVPPTRVLRRDLGALPPRAWTVYLSAVAALSVLILSQAQDTRLAGYVLGGGAIAFLVLAAAALVLVRALSPLRGRVGVTWRFGLANISRRAGGSVIQVVAFGLGIMALLLLSVVRTDILDAWRTSLPPDAPNYFLINVQPGDVAGMRDFFAGEGLSTAELYPMVRGRLVAINGRAVAEDDYEDPRARRLATREFNLSWSETLKSDNRITAGRWWGASGAGEKQFSVEVEIAATLGIDLGDLLTYDIAGRELSGTVSSLRFVEWDSLKANFFVMAPPGVLDGYPATYITSFFLPEGRKAVLIELVRRYPSVTVLDVDALLTKVREIMEQAVLGVEYVFLFTLLAGVIVLLAAIQSTMDERRFETAVVRVMGGQRAALRRGLLAEFVTLGVLAGFLAALAATVIGAVLADQVFQLDYRGNPWIWVIGTLGGGIGIGLAGLASARSALDHSPIETLRES